eukprot:CAMPEP_0197079754 /NCGR_PEP_ID=MMETSP1384-20130603/213783_1 /TAXON_ID=29189 /ORGANISM="Ammonia sp." /LENGTH=81 /DNA_ID=CAMNT_0042518633 /DNA_START=1401 /DNA_END=1646 /DNA_ORIENTATION=-
MCFEVKCNKCNKRTWAGCGRHKESVLARIPADQQCTCDQVKQDNNKKKKEKKDDNKDKDKNQNKEKEDNNNNNKQQAVNAK